MQQNGAVVYHPLSIVNTRLSEVMIGHKKARNMPGFSNRKDVPLGLLNFCFFVHHVLAHFRVEFFNFHLPSHGAFVFGRGVEVTRTR